MEDDDGTLRLHQVAEERQVETLGRVTLIARQVSSAPEIFDLDQRLPRLRADAVPLTRAERRLPVARGTLEPRALERRVLRIEGAREPE